MKEGPNIAHIGALLGDPARANMLIALIGGIALTASELADEAGVTRQTASSHLAKLKGGGLIRERHQGRHRYFALADDDVAAVLESLLGLAAAQGQLRTRPGPRDAAMRKARICYHHLAGEMGVKLYQGLVGRGVVGITSEGITLTEAGEGFLGDWGVDLSALRARRSPLCRECLDWSERRSHLGGSVGRAILSRVLERGWARRLEGTRTIEFSKRGETAFLQTFGA